MRKITPPTTGDRQKFMRSLEASVRQTIKDFGLKRIALEQERVDVEAVGRVTNLCFEDRTAMRVFTYMNEHEDQSFTTSACANALGISEDVAETYLQAFADAGLIDQSVR